MKFAQVMVGFSRTVNLGHYESAKVEAQVVMQLEEGEKPNEVMEEAQFELRRLLEETWKAQHTNTQQKKIGNNT